jgi:DnaJ-class molecular chaperone
MTTSMNKATGITRPKCKKCVGTGSVNKELGSLEKTTCPDCGGTGQERRQRPQNLRG